MPILPWFSIDTVLLDMDGTLLDLHFDNYFWLQYLPQRYAEKHGISLALARAEMDPLMQQQAGQLNWYCTDYWSRELQLPIVQLKREVAHLIALRPDAERFLQALRAAGKQVVLITNAHRDSLSLKMERVQLAPYFDYMISSHDYGFPKENQQFWFALRQEIAFDPQRSLFIDDSLPILRAAGQFGVRHLLAIEQPDSQGARKHTEEFAAVSDYAVLVAALAADPLAN